MARVHVEAEIKEHDRPREWVLCYQKVTYFYEDGKTQKGFRFIWRREDGTLQAARGQARLPSMKTTEKMVQRAKEIWEDYTEE